QTVVVGQQIALSASIPSLPACTSIANQAWSTPPGTAVGGYTATNTSGAVTSISSVNTNAQSYTFYWVDNGNSRTMTYQYTLNTGVSSQAASTTFKVVGPTSPTVTISKNPVVISTVKDTNSNTLKMLSFGALNGTYPDNLAGAPAGIIFTGSASPRRSHPGILMRNFNGFS